MQMVIWFIIPATRRSQPDHKNNALALIVLLQYVPRLYLIFPLSSQIIKATGVVTKTAWAGAAYNLLLYMLASHVCNLFFFWLPLIVILSLSPPTPCWSNHGRVFFFPLLNTISIFSNTVGMPNCDCTFMIAGFRGSMVFAID